VNVPPACAVALAATPSNAARKKYRIRTVFGTTRAQAYTSPSIRVFFLQCLPLARNFPREAVDISRIFTIGNWRSRIAVVRVCSARGMNGERLRQEANMTARGPSFLLISSLLLLSLGGCALKGHGSAARIARQDWSRVSTIAPGSTIRVTLKRGPVLLRTFVAADQSDALTLNLGGRLSRRVRTSLNGLASERPNDLIGVSHGQTVTDGHLRLGPDGVFLDDRKIAAMESVLEHVPRDQVAEIGRVHRATLRGLGWGALIGGGLGLAVTLGACGTNWSQETSSCTNLTPAWVFIGPFWGTVIGGAVGAGTHVSTVVYRAP
jgi:hypothetical protein